MKVSNLQTWQFILLLMFVVVGTSIAFQFAQKKLSGRKKDPKKDIPLPPQTDGGTAIDTSNGLVFRR